NTRVIPARLVGHRTQTGGRWEGLFLGVTESGLWKIIGQTRGRLQPGDRISLEKPDDSEPIGRTEAPDFSQAAASLPRPCYTLTLKERLDAGMWLAEPETTESPFEVLQEWGSVPLPPYLKRTEFDPSDRDRYQTVYAKQPGAVAAPTAGLHFTPELLQACENRHIARALVTLHVGLGTFRPISTDKLSEHQMHSEWCELTVSAVETIARSSAHGGKTIAVGTTSVRTLETAAQSGRLAPWAGETRLFIYPGYQFQSVDGMLTNFHLPKSTLFVLVCAFAGIDFMQEAYRRAVAERYRFFSYGDAMLIL
ncbi:MAG: tRNA preQ1(34) S-adenosylmethionine ribosyltransferase-isomerase QueA, partial [Planctomycetaceae bacterium]